MAGQLLYVLSSSTLRSKDYKSSRSDVESLENAIKKKVFKKFLSTCIVLSDLLITTSYGAINNTCCRCTERALYYKMQVVRERDDEVVLHQAVQDSTIKLPIDSKSAENM